ncbi:hypothetical protein FGE05_14305 [Pseudomonas sp. ICMP22404]|nr:hypothetical protein FGE05_14305 [Pseudomonas sp. ICMP22404]
MHPGSTVGAGLLAKAVCQATSMSTMPPSSRASPLPPFFCSTHNCASAAISCGSEPARDEGNPVLPGLPLAFIPAPQPARRTRNGSAHPVRPGP